MQYEGTLEQTGGSAVEDGLDLLEGDLGARIRALGLEQNVADLAMVGYTVVRDVAPPEFIERLRERIIELVEEQRAQALRNTDGTLKLENTFPDSAWCLLERGRVFEEAVCNPKLVALNEYMLGKGYLASVVGGTVTRTGAAPLGLHTDYIAMGIREPYPVQCDGLTSLWACDEWTEEGGATRLIPRSFTRGRAPVGQNYYDDPDRGDTPPVEGDDEAIPIECPKGSLLVWHSATWHGNCKRTIPGERVSFHTPCVHQARQPLEDYRGLPDEIVDRNPPAFARMIGRESPWGKQTHTTPPGVQIAQMWLWNNTAPSYP